MEITESIRRSFRNDWFKILSALDNKYVKMIYNLMLRDINQLPNKVNWSPFHEAVYDRTNS